MSGITAKRKLLHAVRYLEGLHYIPLGGCGAPGATNWRDENAKQARQLLYHLAHGSAGVIHGGSHYSRRCCHALWDGPIVRSERLKLYGNMAEGSGDSKGMA